jgi:hypothetical protein
VQQLGSGLVEWTARALRLVFRKELRRLFQRNERRFDRCGCLLAQISLCGDLQSSLALEKYFQLLFKSLAFSSEQGFAETSLK